MENRFKTAILALLLMASGIAHAHDAKKLSGFKAPESVVVDKQGRVFVSEIGEFNKDGDGQISVVSSSGKVKVFAKGMNDPKGLAFIGEHLYVADKDRILKVAPNGKWTVFVEKTAFPTPPLFLNDLEPDLQGNLYVSESGDIEKKGGAAGAIYKINPAGKVTTLINHQQNPRIMAPNGLLMDDTGDMLIFVDFATGILYRLDIPNQHLIQLAEGFGGGDGLVLAANNSIYISDFLNGKIYSLSIEDEVKLVKEGFQSAADIGITPDGKTLLVPDMKAGTVTWVHLH
ncbi:SMP-30/gluconolactonase/LRE family protein [Methylobacillus gramineus]|uniref:SMP-30/gluconolactonase/LRE family protein n=1 Tax=Methylobacillus gramineus TaxID=755169 RepID=UPI001CFF9890|nr:SMP-30/gluconolactonase/LRE family protein [Methylobacillus gramineus]MCB5184753.1 SMP-30/gluconolactonase/LRE family protein [Methylobacillus gramineus]